MKGRKSIAWVLVFCVLLCLLSICSATEDVNVEERQEPLMMEIQDAVEHQDVVEPQVEETPEEEMDQPQPEEDLDVPQEASVLLDDEGEQDATADLDADQAGTVDDEPETDGSEKETDEQSDEAPHEELKPAKIANPDSGREPGHTEGNPERSEASRPSQETEDSPESDIPAQRENDPTAGKGGQTSADSQIEDEKNSTRNGEGKADDPDSALSNQDGRAISEASMSQSDQALEMVNSSGDENNDPESEPEIQRGESNEESATGLTDGYTEEALIQMGCKKALVQSENGAELFEHPDKETEPIGRIEHGKEVWVLQAPDEIWDEVYLPGKAAPEGYARGQDMLIIREETRQEDNESEKQEPDADQAQEIIPEEAAQESKAEEIDTEAVESEKTVIRDPNRPPRQVIVTSSLESKSRLSLGDAIVLRAELVNFDEEDVYTCQWQYSKDGEIFYDVPGANELTYAYRINEDNLNYVWGICIDVDE